MQSFEIISEITGIEIVATGNSIREIARLRKMYGRGRWRKLKGTALIQSRDGRYAAQNYTGMKQRGLDAKNSSGNAMWTRDMKNLKSTKIRRASPIRYAICIDNAEYPAALEVLKLYRVLPDPAVEREGDLRVIDESGEDYLYPASYFVPVELPRQTARLLNKSFARAMAHV